MAQLYFCRNPSGPMRRVSSAFLVVLLSFNAFAQFKNTKLDEFGPDTRACEPSITINQRDPKNIVAASVLDNIYYTFDGGATWEKKKITSPFGVYGDPVLISDGKGDIYHFHLSDPTGEGWRNEKSLDHIVCHVSKDGGKTWDEGNSVGYNPPKDQDKPWATVDSKGNLYVTWTQFDKYASTDAACQSNIMLSTSGNGKKWSKAIQISQTPGNCVDDDNTAEGAVPAVSDDKKVFVAWSNQNKIFFDRSFDGTMWLTNDLAIANQPGGWDLKIPGHDRCNGMPVLLVDRSKTVRKGSLYIVWADQRNGEDDTDIWFMRSTNFGDNWTSPTKINDDGAGKHQYLPWMAIDQVTGNLYIVYYDRRNYDDNQTDVYLAYSSDGGSSFKNVKISETPFTPVETSFFGDYNNISAHNGIIAPVWTRMDEGKTSVWTTVIHEENLFGKPSPPANTKKK
jgi:hypothetical protein